VFISPTPYPISSSNLPVSRKRIHSNPSDLINDTIDEETFDAATVLLSLISKKKDISKDTQDYRVERAVCYPSSIKNIYYSMETWQRRHAAICQDIPIWVKRQIILPIQSSRSTTGGRRQYWSDAVIKLGMIDTPERIRFSTIPGTFEDQFDHNKTSNKRPLSNNSLSEIKLVEPIDKLLITEYLYLLMD